MNKLAIRVKTTNPKNFAGLRIDLGQEIDDVAKRYGIEPLEKNYTCSVVLTGKSGNAYDANAIGLAILENE